MAPETRSQQSQELINVSQNAISSPASDLTPDAQEVLVEDSLDPNAPVAQGGAVQDTQAIDEEEDELYANSPRGQASLNAIRSSAKQSTQVVGETILEDAPPVPQSPKILRANQGKARSKAIDSLIDNGAVVIATKSTKASAKATAQPRAQGIKEPPARTKAPAQSQSCKQAASRSQLTKNAGKPPSAPRATHRLSAAAQLRNRRGAASPTPSAAAARSTQQPHRVPTQRQSLQRLDRSSTSAAARGPESTSAMQRPATSQARSRRHGMLAETPKPAKKIESMNAKDLPKPGHNEVQHVPSVATTGNPQVSHDSPDPPVPAEKPQSVSDLPPSSLADKTYNPQKAPERTTRSRETVAYEPTGSLVKCAPSRSRHARPPERAVDNDADPAPPSNQQALDPSLATGSCRTEDSTVASKDVANEPRHEPAQESIEDFEAAVVEDQNDIGLVTEQPVGIDVSSRAKKHPRGPRTVIDIPQPPRRSARLNGQSPDDRQSRSLALSDGAPLAYLGFSEPSPNSSSRPQPQRRSERRPQTPANLRSSPPVEGTKRSRTGAVHLHDTFASRKTSIIAFNESGPRNQGQRSEKKAGLTIALINHLPWTTSSRQRPSSTVSNSRARKAGARSPIAPLGEHDVPTIATVAPSNIAENVSDVLVELARARKSSSGDGVVEETDFSHHSSPLAHVQIRQNDGYADFDEGDGTLVPVANNDKAYPTGSNGAPFRTASQLAMPPPAFKAHPPLIKARSHLTDRNFPSTMGGGPPADKGCTGSRVPQKRRGAVELSEQHTLKKHKAMADSQGSARDHGLNIPSRPIELDDAGSDEEQPLRASPRRVFRNASQGNVDIGGSPIPKNMIVPENATALEIFSHHAEMPPSEKLVLSDVRATRAATHDHATDKAFFDSILAAPPAHSRSLASNQKRHPAPPQAESAAVTDVVFHALDTKRLIIHDDNAQPATDPFTSSEEARKEPHKGSTSSQLIEQLREHAPEHVQRQPLQPRHGNSEHTTELGNKRHRLGTTDGIARVDEKILTTSRKRKRGAETAQNAKSQRARNDRQHNITVNDAEDPDKTLVDSEPEPEPEPKCARRPPKVSKDRPFLAYASHDEAIDVPAIGPWRHDLQPHQMNLFDELVGISHKLVRHLVRYETAMREAMRDYRTRGIRLIEEAETRQAAEYRAALEVLEKDRQHQLTWLEELSGSFDGRVRERKRTNAERMQRLTLFDEEEESLKRELAAFA